MSDQKLCWRDEDVVWEEAVESVDEMGTSKSGFRGHAGIKGHRGGSSHAPGLKLGKSDVKLVSGELGIKNPSYMGRKVSASEYDRLLKGPPPGTKDRPRTRTPEPLPHEQGDKIRDEGEIPDRMGRCYEIAGRFMIDNMGKGCMLVHATLYPRMGPFEDQPFFHAFIVKDDKVWDPVFNAYHDKKEYYEHYSITDVKAYNDSTAAQMMLKYKNWGSWE